MGRGKGGRGKGGRGKGKGERENRNIMRLIPTHVIPSENPRSRVGKGRIHTCLGVLTPPQKKNKGSETFQFAHKQA